MIRKILVYENTLLDEHPALDRARQLAKHGSVQLKIVDVVNSPSTLHGELHRPMRNLIELEQRDRLEAMCEPLRGEKLDYSVELLRGRPFAEIVRKVVHEGSQLVLKSGHARHEDSPASVGPVDMRLVRNCPCPVWIETVSTMNPITRRRIVVALDPQAEDNELNTSLLTMGEWLASVSDARLHIISTWQVPNEDLLREKLPSSRLARYAAELQDAAQKNLDSLLDRDGNLHSVAGAPEPIVCFSEGSPDPAILDYVAEFGNDLLIIGTVGRTKVHGLLIGNTADHVLHGINCSVLAIKPDNMFRV